MCDGGKSPVAYVDLYWFAHLCVQTNLNKIITSLHITIELLLLRMWPVPDRSEVAQGNVISAFAFPEEQCMKMERQQKGH